MSVSVEPAYSPDRAAAAGLAAGTSKAKND